MSTDSLDKALAAGLPPGQDAYLKKIIDAAAGRYRDKLETNRKLAAFSSGRYTDAEFDAAIASLDTSVRGSTPEAHISTWLLGLTPLRPEHRGAVIAHLRVLLGRPPSFLLMASWKRMLSALHWTASIAFVLSAAASGILLSDGRAGTLLVFIPLMLLLGLLLYPVTLFKLHSRELRSARELRFLAAHALGRLRATAAVDALAAACLEGNDHVSVIAAAALRVVLPDLTAGQFGALGPEAVPNICRLLKRCAPAAITHEDVDYGLTLDLLTALEKMGDARAIPTVRQGASEWQDRKLSAVATRTLAVLEERQRSETERGTLLRGAAQPAIADAELLRASTAHTESRPEQLLRPTS